MSQGIMGHRCPGSGGTAYIGPAMMVEPQDLSLEDTVRQLREAIQGVGDGPLVMVASLDEIIVD